MATPIIATAGLTNGLLKITDHEGTVSRIPLNSSFVVFDSSNSDVYRIEISHSKGDIILLFASAEEVVTALSALDALY